MELEKRTACKTYVNYRKYYVQFHPSTGTFDCGYEDRGAFLRGVKTILRAADGSTADLSGREVTTEWEMPNFCPYDRLTLYFGGGEQVKVRFTVLRDGVEVEGSCPEGYALQFAGEFVWGSPENSFAVCIDREQRDMRSACGPAVSTIDNALFDRAADSAAEILEADRLRLAYDWEKETYTFRAEGMRWRARVREDLFRTMFRTPYRAINKKNTFPTPPVGWMTWYAVMFGACEKAVLENAAWQKEHLADFGANTVWVDWEWYHSAFSVHGPEGIDFFHPDPARYPHGMKYVADRIREMGLIPALWIGPTHEPAKTQFIEENPDAVLAHEVEWCGEYFFDLTSEKFLEKYLPAAVDKVKEWGYEAVKWDCLPVTLLFADKYHEYMAKPEMTSEQALRGAVRRVRERFGDDFYMLSCAGAADREVLFAVDMFDGARIGGDIFSWQEFINDFVARVMRFYAYHNTQIYCDPDNLVIRPEYNDMDQAISRTSLLAVYGLPVTLGDNLPDLPAERVELLKRCIPPMDAHSMDIRETEHEPDRVITNLTISRPFEQWNVVDVLNLLEEENRITVDFDRDLHLEEGRYLVYDFWNKEFLGIVDKELTLNLRARASSLLSVRRCRNVPQLVSTSRHITQGGPDLKSVEYDEQKRVLRGISDVVAGDPYEITAYDPEKEVVAVRRFLPEKTGEMEWEIVF